jgi:NAD-dependent dihydropyrimidine dehydrogenase PreA subunit
MNAPIKHDHRVYFACEICEEFNPEGAVSLREDVGVMPDGTWLCSDCYSDCEKSAYGMVAHDVDDFEFPRFEDLPRPEPYTAALEGSVAVPAWQDISTVPKDGSKVDLLFEYPRGRQNDCQWREGGVYGDGDWYWSKPQWGCQPGLGIDWHLLPESEWTTENYPNMAPTHWMTPPALPRQERLTPELCEYCNDGKRTGLPGNACENCMNTGLKYPSSQGAGS